MVGLMETPTKYDVLQLHKAVKKATPNLTVKNSQKD
uniref:Mobile element protein n=1 Tax=Ascaris lumbricoides TaxID=6252 RepID=A0A0M3HLX7_ASCLU